jgi:hypothetical protein
MQTFTYAAAFEPGDKRGVFVVSFPDVPEAITQGQCQANHPFKWARGALTEVLILLGKHGERGGTRTHDPMIKSHVLYRLSYALTCRAV